MKEALKMIRDMDGVFIPGQTEESMKDHGLMVNSMELASIFFQMANTELECGKMERELSGLTIKMILVSVIAAPLASEILQIRDNLK